MIYTIRSSLAERFKNTSYFNTRITRAKVHLAVHPRVNNYDSLVAKCGTLANAIKVTQNKNEITCTRCLRGYKYRND
jgi:hypothetical protein